MRFLASGEGLSLLAAVTWAVAIVLFKKSGDALSPLALNLFKNLVGLLCFAVTVLITGDSLLPPAATDEVLLLLTSGILGIGVADTMLFRSLNILGASRSAIVDCLYSPFTVLCSYLILGESLSALTIVGALCIVAGIAIVGREQPAVRIPTRLFVEGAGLGIAAMALMAIGIVMVKPILSERSVLMVITWRLIAGSAALALVAVTSRRRRAEVRYALTPSRSWLFAVPGSVAGAYLALIFWVAGMKYTTVMTAAILNQTSTLLVVLLAALFLKEALTWPKMIAVALGVVGSLLALV
ncbi:MAG: DMT family transporter [Deltaproteobacteria bacterium]|nr:DMT family transporter [Deltaproteobacteria bacterium]